MKKKVWWWNWKNQLYEKESAVVQLENQLYEKESAVVQLENQLYEKESAVVQLENQLYEKEVSIVKMGDQLTLFRDQHQEFENKKICLAKQENTLLVLESEREGLLRKLAQMSEEIAYLKDEVIREREHVVALETKTNSSADSTGSKDAYIRKLKDLVKENQRTADKLTQEVHRWPILELLSQFFRIIISYNICHHCNFQCHCHWLMLFKFLEKLFGSVVSMITRVRSHGNITIWYG